MESIRHDPNCIYCHGTSVGAFLVGDRKVVAIPCPCGMPATGDDDYRPPLGDARQPEKPADTLRKRLA